jgi:O-antigen/teichoic acid export membrane protein
LTAVLILLGYGMPGLAVATGLPPLLGGLAAMIRVVSRFRDTTMSWYRPKREGCKSLLREGIGVWVSGIGARLFTASAALVFAIIGRPDWATIFAATGKVAQVARPLCFVLPDSALIGLSQVHGEGNLERSRQLVKCLLFLYLLFPGLIAIALFVANPWFVSIWIGADYFAGHYINALLALNLIISSAISGLYKVVSVVGHRMRIGVATLVYGGLVVGLGCLLGIERGMRGLAEGAILAGVGMGIPYGLYVIREVYGISLREILAGSIGRWFLWSFPLLALAAGLAWTLSSASSMQFLLMAGVLIAIYLIVLRPTIALSPWPEQVRNQLERLKVIPATSRNRPAT